MEFKMWRVLFRFIFVFNMFLILNAAGSPPDFFMGRNLYADTKLGADPSDSMTIFRLPRNIRPKEYNLKIRTELEPSFTFSGTVSIKVGVDFGTKSIVLNSRDLEITSVTLLNQRKFQINSNYTVDAPNEQITIYSAEISTHKEYTVNIDFKGTLSDNMKGYYRSSYGTKDNKKWLAITQFEATFARRAFPCFDEPLFKTPYTIELLVKQGQTALSNMPIDTTTPSENNMVWVKFKKSEPMPTYLVAYSVSPFVVHKKDNERVQVWTREDAIADCKYIQEEGEKLLKALEAYLKVDYKLPKLDIVAVPDFSAGAMENYGLTTYRERFVHKNEIATSRNIEFIVSVVAHEFSHQWFGDMVTPEWWDYTWLNEAFATFFEYRIPDLVHSDWRMDELFVVEQVHTAMMADLANSHPMTAKVQSPSEIEEIFDHIIYNKGGSVLRMLEHFITPPTFQAALSTYLDSTYSSATQGVTTPENFFDCVIDTLDEITKQLWHDSIYKFKESWVDQSGYPLVTVVRDYLKKTASVSQQQFLFEVGEKPSEKKWMIPITYTTSNEKNFTLEEAKKKMFVFPADEKVASIDVQSARWVIANIQEIGFYRVNYDSENWKEIISTLKTSPADIHQLNRAQLIDDSFNLARAGIISYTVPMTLSNYLQKETDPFPWLAAFPNFSFLLQRYHSQLLDRFKKHISGLIKNTYEGLVAKAGKSHAERTALITISQWACYVGIESCVNNAKSEMSKLVQNPEYRIESDVRESVLCTGLNMGGVPEWEAVWNHYLKTNVATEKVLTLNILPCAKHEGVLDFFLKELLSGENIRTQDHMYLIRSIAGKSYHIHPALKLLRENYPQIKTTRAGERVFKVMINFLKHGVTTETELQEIQTLAFSPETDHHHAHMLNHTIDHIKKNFEWQEKNLAAVKQWFEDEDHPTENPDDDHTNPPGPGPNPGPDPVPPSSATQPIATIVSCSLVFFVLYRKVGLLIL